MKSDGKNEEMMSNPQASAIKLTEFTPKYARQLEVLQEISQNINSGEKMELVLETALHHLLHTLGYQATQIYRLSPSGKDLWLYLERGPGSKPVTQTPDIFSIDEDNIVSHAIQRGQPIYLPDINEGLYSYYPQAQSGLNLMHSELAVPFRSGQDWLGVLRIQSNKLDGFNKIDITFLSGLAALLASAIKNSQTIQQLQDDLQEIRILYNLQRQADLNKQGEILGKKSPLGYEYDRVAVAEMEQLSSSAHLALTREQLGVSTLQEGSIRELVTPIKLYGETIGVIGIEESIYGEDVLPDDISLLEEVSIQVALAIENARLLQQTQERTKELSVLFEASRQLSETIDLQQIYEILALQIKSYFNADSSSVWLINKDRTHFEQMVLQGQKSDKAPLLEAIDDSTTLRQILKQPAFGVEYLADPARPFLVTSKIHNSDQDDKALPGVHTIATFPLMVRNRLVGILRVKHLNQHREYSKNELQLAQAIITQVTVAIENAQLFQQTQTALSETQKLYEISRSLAESTDLEDIFAVIVESVRVYDVDRVSISLLDRAESGSIDTVTIAASWDRDSDQLLPVGSKFSADEYSLVHAFTEPPFEPLISEDLSRIEAQDARMDDAFRHFMQDKLGAVTLFSAPMFLGTDYKGVLSISTRKPHHYSKQEIRIYQTLTDQAIVAIENLRLFEATKKSLYNSEILSHLSQDLLVADTVETIYNLTMQAIADTNPDRGAGIFMYDQIEGGVELELVALWDNPHQQWPPIATGVRFSTEALGLSPLLKTGQTVISITATEDERFSDMLRQLLIIMQINTLLAVPIWLNREVGGFILIGNQKFIPFAPETIRLYEDIARQTSGALENRRLFEETQYRATLLQTAAEISQAATSSLELEILLPKTVELIKDRFDFYHVSIFLVDDYQKHAVIEASTGAVGQQMLADQYKFKVGGKSIVGIVTNTGEPRIALDTGKDAIYFDNPLLPDTHSEMALPLIARGQVIGALDVQSTKRAAFSKNDITILQSMADQLANAIEAARSFKASGQALKETQKLHEYYLNEQWRTYLKDQQSATVYRLTQEGLEATEEKPWRLDEIERVIEIKQPVLIPAHTSNATFDLQQPNGKSDNNQPTSAEIEEAAQDTSLFIAPLTLNGQVVIGAVDFEIPSQEQLNEDDLMIIEAVANQAAQAIEGVRQFEQTQAARKEAEALYEVGRTLVATEDEQEMLYTVLSEMLSTLGLVQGGVLFFEDDRKFGKLHALFINGEPAEPGLRFPVAGNLSYEKLIATKQPVAIEDVTTDPLLETVREINLALGIASLLLVPIIIDDEVIGAIGADALGKKHIFTEREINLALAMADQLSIILQNRHLLAETQRRAVQLQTSSDVGRVATSILDQETMLSQAVELIRDRFGFYHVQIFLIDEARQFAVLYKSTGEAGQKLLALGHKLAIGSQSVIGQVTYQHRPIVVRDTDAVEANALHRRNEFLPETRAELAIPLQVGDTLIGALDVQSTSPNTFSVEDIAVLETLAAQLAIAIQNARAFTEQQETAERLKEIDKLKTQFLANMSHELRTPLNSIIGFSRVILKGIDGPLTDLQKTDLTSIHNSGQHLLGLINNILDLSKIEAGKMELNFEEVELEPIIKGVMSTAIALVKDKSVTLHQKIEENLPLVWADPTRIRQIILNLVSNACKFTDEGTVTIHTTTDHEKVTIRVTDTGIGIPEENLTHVFEEFTQVDASTTRKVGGTGLGLPISRHFVEMHNGQIWVESKLGHGSTFNFTIPIEQVKEEEDIPASLIDTIKKDGHGKIIVAIDDDPGVITLYERFLEQQDYRVIGINHSHDVLPQIKELAPAAILLDVLMPEKDGWGVLRTLKDDPVTKDIPVIICSIISDKNRGFSLGAADYLIKPIVEDELIKALKHLENQHKEQMKVLVVDDQADDILLIRRILEAQSNYKIFEANNGYESMKLVQSVEPDLIMLDLSMPEMDGFMVVEALKNNEKTRSIPIIIVSAKELTPAEHLVLTGQVEVLLRKGIFTENELLEDVSQALKRIQKEVTL